MVDPVSRAILNATFNDEPEPEEGRPLVAEARAWFRENPGGIPFEEVLGDFGLTLADVREPVEGEEG
mgnify:FL=1